MTFKELGPGTQHRELAQHAAKAGPEALGRVVGVVPHGRSRCSLLSPLTSASRYLCKGRVPFRLP